MKLDKVNVGKRNWEEQELGLEVYLIEVYCRFDLSFVITNYSQ